MLMFIGSYFLMDFISFNMVFYCLVLAKVHCVLFYSLRQSFVTVDKHVFVQIE